jgi:hypothetical protein
LLVWLVLLHAELGLPMLMPLLLLLLLHKLLLLVCLH